jgi:hypothetical protein
MQWMSLDRRAGVPSPSIGNMPQTRQSRVYHRAGQTQARDGRPRRSWTVCSLPWDRGDEMAVLRDTADDLGYDRKDEISEREGFIQAWLAQTSHPIAPGSLSCDGNSGQPYDGIQQAPQRTHNRVKHNLDLFEPYMTLKRHSHLRETSITPNRDAGPLLWHAEDLHRQADGRPVKLPDLPDPGLARFTKRRRHKTRGDQYKIHKHSPVDTNIQVKPSHPRHRKKANGTRFSAAGDELKMPTSEALISSRVRVSMSPSKMDIKLRCLL